MDMFRARLVRCCWVAVALGVGGMLNATRVEAQEVERAAEAPAPASAPAEPAKYLPAELDGVLLIRLAALAGGEFAKTVRADGAELLYVELAREFHRYSGLPLEQTDCWLLSRSVGTKEGPLCEVFASSPAWRGTRQGISRRQRPAVLELAVSTCCRLLASRRSISNSTWTNLGTANTTSD